MDEPVPKLQFWSGLKEKGNSRVSIPSIGQTPAYGYGRFCRRIRQSQCKTPNLRSWRNSPDTPLAEILRLGIVLLLAKYYLGAFSAAPKTGLSGAPRSRAPAPMHGHLWRPSHRRWLCIVAAPHPSNPLRSCGVRPAATDCIQVPQGVSMIPMIDTLPPF
jgi:hypothetical protein